MTTYVHTTIRSLVVFSRVCFTFLCVRFESPEVKYLTLHNLDDVLELFTNQEKEVDEEEDQDDRLEDEERDSHFGKCLIVKWRE